MTIALVLAMATNCAIPAAKVAGWTDQHLESGRIRLTYPSVMSEDAAQDFLENRERALEFAEEFLQTRLEEPLEITVNVSLLTTSGGVWPSRSLTEQGPKETLRSAGRSGELAAARRRWFQRSWSSSVRVASA